MPKEMSSPVASEKAVKKNKKITSEKKKSGHEIDDIFSSKTEKKEPGNEIDEIFLSKKKRKKEQEEIEKQKEESIKKIKKMKRKSKIPDGDGFVDPPPRPRKKTGEGYAVYTEEELGMTKSDGGDTSLCPFDCTCCF